MTENLGGGIALAIAAGLWLLYLMPSWLRRREYLNTSRNAVRMQQVVRVLAETAEAPEEIRVELSQRGIAEQRRALRAAEKSAVPAPRAAVPNSAPAAVGPRGGLTPAQCLRRTRLATTLVTAVAVVVLGASLLPGLFGGVVAGWSAGIAGAVAIGGAWMLSTINRTERRRRSTYREAVRPATTFIDPMPAQQAVTEVEEDRTWTPVPLPRPTYLPAPSSEASRARAREGAAEAAAAAAVPAPRSAAVAAAQLRAESEAATARLRQAESALPSVVDRQPSAAQRSVPATRYARMGVIDADVVEPGLGDLDDVFRRRASGL